MKAKAQALARMAMQVLWPAFLMAGVLEMLVFAVIDPADLRGVGGAVLPWPREAVYTLSFLIFWLVVATACAGTALLTIDVPDGSADDEARATPPREGVVGREV